MTSRSTLHHNQLDAFREFLKCRGWRNHPVKGDYEVLRMTHPHVLHTLLVYKTNGERQHYTTFDVSHQQARVFILAKRQAAERMEPLLRLFEKAIGARDAHRINELSHQIEYEARHQAYDNKDRLGYLNAQAEAILDHLSERA